MAPIISARALGKRYRLGAKARHRTLRETITDAAAGLVSRRGGGADDAGTLWALQDVSFDVEPGTTLGVIGRNGAGKTTLLKILSRVTEPTAGEVRLRGRVASLLEVGTGFHPELTGRENIYLNGSICGMRRREIRAKFDEIVAFAEVERFIDTPVKRYSSGMYVRLAFAVAAHLEPEILVVDEVLAVGDAAFQRKCLGRMEHAASGGRTVLFVSHNLQSVRALCARCLLLREGRVIADAPTDEAIGRYSELLRGLRVDERTGVGNAAVRRGEAGVRITGATLRDREDRERFHFRMGESVRFHLTYRIERPMRGLAVYLGLRSGLTRELVTTVRHVLSEERLAPGATGTVCVELPEVFIRPGEYPLYLHLGEAVQTVTNFDLLDDLTAPLVITAPDRLPNTDLDPAFPLGYFSVPSRLATNEILRP